MRPRRSGPPHCGLGAPLQQEPSLLPCWAHAPCRHTPGHPLSPLGTLLPSGPPGRLLAGWAAHLLLLEAPPSSQPTAGWWGEARGQIWSLALPALGTSQTHVAQAQPLTPNLAVPTPNPANPPDSGNSMAALPEDHTNSKVLFHSLPQLICSRALPQGPWLPEE